MHLLTRLRPVLALPSLLAILASAVLTGALVLFAPAGPALAHDALEGSAPASGQTLQAAPSEVRLDFNNRPLGVGVEVRVTDASGASWSEGAPDVLDRSVHQPLRAGAPAGAYTVVWRVVSSDSHPIEGTFGFTVAEGGQGSTTPAASPGASGPAIQTAEPGATATPAPASKAPSQDVPWLIVVFAIVAVALLAALGWGARRRLRAGDES